MFDGGGGGADVGAGGGVEIGVFSLSVSSRSRLSRSSTALESQVETGVRRRQCGELFAHQRESLVERTQARVELCACAVE